MTKQRKASSKSYAMHVCRYSRVCKYLTEGMLNPNLVNIRNSSLILNYRYSKFLQRTSMKSDATLQVKALCARTAQPNYRITYHDNATRCAQVGEFPEFPTHSLSRVRLEK